VLFVLKVSFIAEVQTVFGLVMIPPDNISHEGGKEDKGQNVFLSFAAFACFARV
jgi:hypothetical protein